jgi:hypothetical protein
VGAAKAVAAGVSATAGAAAGHAVAHAADVAFVHAMTRAVLVAAVVALVGALVALLFLPAFATVPSGELSGVAVAAARALPAQPTTTPGLAHATLAVLADCGHASLNFNAVSAQSGVGTRALRTTWSDKLRAVVDSVDHLVGEPERLEGESVLDDAIAAVRHLVVSLQDRVPPPVLTALIGAGGRDPSLAAALRRGVLEPRERVLRDRLDRAVAAGELSPEVDCGVLVDVLLGPVYHRTIITGQPFEPEFPTQVVTIALGPHLQRDPDVTGI